MKHNRIPQGPTMVQSFLKSFKMVNEPIEVVTGNMEQYGDTYAIKAGVDRYVIVTQDPDFVAHVFRKNHKNYAKSHIATQKLGRFIGKGLLTSNGEYWLRQRRLIQPGFHKQKIQKLYSVMQQSIDDFAADFPVGDEVDVYPQMNRLAFKVVINSLFNIPMSQESNDELREIISDVQEFIVKDIRQPYKYWWFVLSGEMNKHIKISERAREIIREVIQKRKASGEQAGDLLDMLLEARYEDNQEPMSEEQIIDEILILLVAGHETTANALSWMLYLLANHTDTLEQLRKSTQGLGIEEAIIHPGLVAVIKETMRLYPPAWISDRVALEADTINGYDIPAGSNVVLYLYGLHHNAKFWNDPEHFNPDRFADENVEKVTSTAFYPFGGGPRICIGGGFAMAEMALAIKTFIQQFDIHSTAYTPNMIPLVTLRPDKVILKVTKKVGN